MWKLAVLTGVSQVAAENEEVLIITGAQRAFMYNKVDGSPTGDEKYQTNLKSTVQAAISNNVPILVVQELHGRAGGKAKAGGKGKKKEEASFIQMMEPTTDNGDSLTFLNRRVSKEGKAVKHVSFESKKGNHEETAAMRPEDIFWNNQKSLKDNKKDAKELMKGLLDDKAKAEDCSEVKGKKAKADCRKNKKNPLAKFGPHPFMYQAAVRSAHAGKGTNGAKLIRGLCKILDGKEQGSGECKISKKNKHNVKVILVGQQANIDSTGGVYDNRVAADPYDATNHLRVALGQWCGHATVGGSPETNAAKFCKGDAKAKTVGLYQASSNGLLEYLKSKNIKKAILAGPHADKEVIVTATDLCDKEKAEKAGTEALTDVRFIHDLTFAEAGGWSAMDESKQNKDMHDKVYAAMCGGQEQRGFTAEMYKKQLEEKAKAASTPATASTATASTATASTV